MQARKARGAGRLGALLAVALVVGAVVAAVASAIILRGGELIIHAHGGLSPTVLPKHRKARG